MGLKPIQIWGHWGAPNPWKVCIVMEELTIPYNIQFVEFSDVKKEDYTRINPNGRLPAIQDPNTNLTLWESGAIVEYLVDQYDTDGKISYKMLPEKYLTQQWLAFQISGQGPYFGQATWFARFHSEKLPSAVDRYVNEIFRVTGVLDKALEGNENGWLVGDKLTYADLSFITWSSVGNGLLKELGKLEEFEQKFTIYTKWMRKMEEREAVKKIRDQMARGRAEHDLK